jgi:hypothetical protein
VTDGLIGFRTDTYDEAELARRKAIAETRGLEELDPDDLEVLERNGRRLLVHVPDGTLWAQCDRAMADVLADKSALRVVFEPGTSGKLTPRYLQAARTVGNLPDTLQELEERESQKQAARERGRREQAAALEELRKLAAPVTFDDTIRDGARLTLREAAEVVVQAGGTIRVVGSRLVVSLPPGATLVLGAPTAAAKAAARLYLAEEAVLAAAGKGGDVDVAKLPDRPILPNGALAP